MLEFANALVLMLLGAMLFFPRLWHRWFSHHCRRRKLEHFYVRCFPAITPS